MNQDLRLTSIIKSIALPQLETLPHGTVLCGYPDDEGIVAGGGRAGAADGPSAIRNQLNILTPHAFSPVTPLLYDLGDASGDSRAVRHTMAQQMVESALRSGHRCITMGGGHDYGFPDGAAFINTSSERPLVINIDAHLDVRDERHGITSGTPFFRLLEKTSAIDLVEIGLQNHCNAREHVAYAIRKGVLMLTYEEWLMSAVSLVEFTSARLVPLAKKKRRTYLSLDMDVMSSAVAPGCSSPQPQGFLPQDLIPLLNYFFTNLDVRLFGVYETAPKLDFGQLTAKLAAHFIHRFMYV